MRYSEFQPKWPLNNFVECFWTLESDTPSRPERTERVLPDGCSEIILNFASPFAQHEAGSTTVQPRNFIVGQITGPLLISPTGPVQLIGIRFHPGGTTPFVRVPMHELTDKVTELGRIASKLETKLLSAAAHLPRLDQKVSVLESVLTQHLQAGQNDFPLLQTVQRMVQHSGMIPIDQLANQSGLSTRQLERRFLHEVGIGPKLLSRILRFQQVFRALETEETSWPIVAIDCGYYDQAHLIRDFRQFAQQTPSILFAEQSRFTESFTRKHRVSGFSNTRQAAKR